MRALQPRCNHAATALQPHFPVCVHAYLRYLPGITITCTMGAHLAAWYRHCAVLHVLPVWAKQSGSQSGGYAMSSMPASGQAFCWFVQLLACRAAT